ncbi:MAG: transcription antiterminator [Tyzzerella sp.]|uniref:Transcription antiterminator n=1 Tax=Candidatus Fimicola merdigallinarum TaxID=2840819 RepID=A0A9D9H3X4_9FIRM|nr:transcription antiterminator [Candidatus Fimicola merdigallinarum]
MFPYYRLNKIFNYINKNEIASINDLCSLLNITDRTLRTDIQTINNVLKDYGATIKLKRKLGYFLEISDPDRYEEFLTKLSDTEKYSIELDSTEDRMKHLLNILLYKDNYISLDELSEQVFVGTNTLKNYIKSLNNILSKYNLECISKSNIGIKIIGNEDDKRKCLVESIINTNLQSYITTFTKDEYILFKDIDLYKLKDIVFTNLKNANIEINDYNLKNLVIHFALMISRVKNDYYINNNFNIHIDDNYQKFVDDISKEIEDNFDISISEGEKNYIYLHLIANSRIDNLSNSDNKIKKLINDLLSTIYFDYNFDLRNDEVLLNDLFVHLKSILTTKYLELNKRNPLLNTIKSNFPLAFDITLSCVTKVFKNTPFKLTEDEIGYISLHIGAGLERCFSGTVNVKNVIVICGSGQATSRMLETRINIFFKDKINIVSRMSYNNFISLPKSEFRNIDFIISTIPIETDIDIPTAVVNFVFKTEDIETISKLLNKISNNTTKNSIEFFNKNLFLHLDKCESKESLLDNLFDIMKKENVIDDEYISSVIDREKLSKTNLNDVFALPHPIKPCAKKTQVAVAIIDEPVKWSDDSTVQIVFLLAIKQGEQKNIEHLYDIFIEVVNNTVLQNRVLQSNTFEEFINNLYSI